MWRAAFFALVGVAFLVHWVVADPTYDESETQDEWPDVLAFSGIILSLGLALPLFARLVGGRGVFRVSLVPAAGAVLGSVANIVEDGLQIGWAFYAFVLASAIMLLGLVGLTAMIAYVGRRGHRLLAVVPAGTMASIILYVIAGGPLMLATWLAAAAAALVLPTRAATQSA